MFAFTIPSPGSSLTHFVPVPAQEIKPVVCNVLSSSGILEPRWNWLLK